MANGEIGASSPIVKQMRGRFSSTPVIGPAAYVIAGMTGGDDVVGMRRSALCERNPRAAIEPIRLSTRLSNAAHSSAAVVIYRPIRGKMLSGNVTLMTEEDPKPPRQLGSTVPLEGRVTISSSMSSDATVIPYPQRLLTLARKLIDDGEFSIGVVVAHMACEIATERTLSEAFTAKGISYLEKSVTEFLNGYNLANDRIRKFYTALTGDQIEQTDFWPKFKESATRRNEIVHSGVIATKPKAEESYAAAKDLVAHLKK